MASFKKSLDSAKDAKAKGNTKPLYSILSRLFHVLRNTKIPFWRKKVAQAIQKVENEIKN